MSLAHHNLCSYSFSRPVHIHIHIHTRIHIRHVVGHLHIAIPNRPTDQPVSVPYPTVKATVTVPLRSTNYQFTQCSSSLVNNLVCSYSYIARWCRCSSPFSFDLSFMICPHWSRDFREPNEAEDASIRFADWRAHHAGKRVPVHGCDNTESEPEAF